MSHQRTDSEYTVITCFTYESYWQKWQGFRNMGLVPPLLKNTPNLKFFKILGSGSGNGFSKWPHWGQYFLLTVWTKLESAQAFFDQNSASSAMQRVRKHRSTEWSLVLEPYQSFGQWTKVNPFSTDQHERNPSSTLVVLTRAQIKWSMLWRFWHDVPEISASMSDFPDCLFAVGVGELPLIQQATFSLWRSEKAMKAFAYQNHEHKDVVKRTRQLQWYSEELFARFNLLEYWGELPQDLLSAIAVPA